MRGKFSERLGLWRWRDQTGGRLGNPQHHGVAVGDEDIAHTVRARASRDQRKTTPEEWMPRVCDFPFSQVVYQWVVDRGMKLFDPSIAWHRAFGEEPGISVTSDCCNASHGLSQHSVTLVHPVTADAEILACMSNLDDTAL